MYMCHVEGGTDPCTAADYRQNRISYPAYEAQNNGGRTPAMAPPTTDKLAAGGPPVPDPPGPDGNCPAYISAVKKWAAYQNAHRPAGATWTAPSPYQQQRIDNNCQAVG